MKIAKIEQFFPRKRVRLVKITTDNGLEGWGETTLEGKPRSVMAAVDELADYLVGKDPLRCRKRVRLVKITTDNGREGWGETTLEGKPRSVMAAVDELADYLVGKDPL